MPTQICPRVWGQGNGSVSIYSTFRVESLSKTFQGMPFFHHDGFCCCNASGASQTVRHGGLDNLFRFSFHRFRNRSRQRYRSRRFGCCLGQFGRHRIQLLSCYTASATRDYDVPGGGFCSTFIFSVFGTLQLVGWLKCGIHTGLRRGEIVVYVVQSHGARSHGGAGHGSLLCRIAGFFG